MEPKQISFPTISELIEHSRTMLRHAEADDWETVVKEEMIQRERIDAYFSQPSNVVNEYDMARAIQELLQINDRLEILAVEARDRVNIDVNTVSNGRRAVNAYANNAR